MSRLVLSLLLALPAAGASAACSIAGTAFDAHGRPMQDAVVRLVDLQTGRAWIGAADAHATFAFSSDGGGEYRLDILGPAIAVTGSKIPTRAVMGRSDAFACSGQARRDVHAEVY